MAVISIVSEDPLFQKALTQALEGRHAKGEPGACALMITDKPQSADAPQLVLSQEFLPISLRSLEEKISAALQEEAGTPVALAAGWQLLKKEKALSHKTGKTLAITEKEVALLAALTGTKGKAVSREELLAKVWGYAEGIDTHTLETHIHRLRSKLKEAGLDGRVESGPEGYQFNSDE